MNLPWREVCVLVCVHAPHRLVYVYHFEPAVGSSGCFKVYGRWWIGNVRGPAEVWASCCINNGGTAGCIYSNSGIGPWQHQLEGGGLIYEIPYILPALPGYQSFLAAVGSAWCEIGRKKGWRLQFKCVMTPVWLRVSVLAGAGKWAEQSEERWKEREEHMDRKKGDIGFVGCEAILIGLHSFDENS